MNIYVGNLSYDVTDETLQGTFESFGEVTSAKVIKDKYTGQSLRSRLSKTDKPGNPEALPLWRCLRSGKVGELYPC